MSKCVVSFCVLNDYWLIDWLINQGCSTSPPSEAQCTRNLGLGYKLCAVIPVAVNGHSGLLFGRLQWLSRCQHRGRSQRSMTALFEVAPTTLIAHFLWPRPLTSILTLKHDYEKKQHIKLLAKGHVRVVWKLLSTYTATHPLDCSTWADKVVVTIEWAQFTCNCTLRQRDRYDLTLRAQQRTTD